MKPIITGHSVRLRYIPASNTRAAHWRASWQGWPSDDYRRVTRRITAGEVEGAIRQAAEAFVTWLGKGSSLIQLPRRHTVATVHACYDGRDWTMIVTSNVDWSEQ